MVIDHPWILSLISWQSFENDLRPEAYVFSVPIPTYNKMVQTVHMSTTLRVGVVSLSLKFWMQTFMLLCLQSAFNVVIAIIVYFSIVQPQENNVKPKNKAQPSRSIVITKPTVITIMSPYIIGYGVICPILLAWPFYLFQNVWGMYNIALMLCLTGAVPNILLLRVSEAIHGLLPDFCYNKSSNGLTTKSPLTMLIWYFSATLQFQFDSKTRQPKSLSQRLLWKKLCSFVSVFLQTSLLYSLLLPCNFRVFEVTIPHESTAILSSRLWSFFHPFKYVNAFLMASLLSLVLEGTVGWSVVERGTMDHELWFSHSAYPLFVDTQGVPRDLACSFH
jgi:hypothetical protein